MESAIETLKDQINWILVHRDQFSKDMAVIKECQLKELKKAIKILEDSERQAEDEYLNKDEIRHNTYPLLGEVCHRSVAAAVLGVANWQPLTGCIITANGLVYATFLSVC